MSDRENLSMRISDANEEALELVAAEMRELIEAGTTISKMSHVVKIGSIQSTAKIVRAGIRLQSKSQFRRVRHTVYTKFELRKFEAGSNERSICPTSFWLDALIDPNLAQDIQANLEDLFEIWVDRHGDRRARWIYRWQVFLTIGGHWLSKVLDLLERAAKLAKRISGA